MLINISINKTQVCLSNIFSKALIKKHQAAATLISNYESRNENNCSLKKCISGRYFMDALRNCSLKKCISA